jgi:hypothetical protein
MLFAGASSSQAGMETRSARLVIRVNVIRSCSVETRSSAAAESAVLLTCSRSATEPGVASTVDGARPVTRVVPIPARQTTVVATPRPVPAAANAAVMTPGTGAGTATRQLVILNF